MASGVLLLTWAWSGCPPRSTEAVEAGLVEVEGSLAGGSDRCAGRLRKLQEVAWPTWTCSEPLSAVAAGAVEVGAGVVPGLTCRKYLGILPSSVVL